MTAHPYLTPMALRYKGISIVLLAFTLFISLAQFAYILLIQNHVIAFYGVQPQDVSMAVLAMYAGIVTCLPLHFRFIRFFVMRNYLLAAFGFSILLNVGCLLTHDIVVLIILRFVQGTMAAICAGSMLIVIFSTQPEAKRAIVGSAIFFGAILSTAVIIGMVSSWVAVNMDWNFIFYGLITLQLVAVVVCLALFKDRGIQKPYPLYQVDWPGIVFFAVFALCLCYVMIYGPRLYWFTDFDIVRAALLGGGMLLLFIYRQNTVKRPLVNLGVFRHRKFIFGLSLLLLFYGIKDTINLIYGYASGTLGWSATDVVQLGLCNITGVIIAIWFSAKMILRNKMNVPKLLLCGFLVMMGYNFYMYLCLTSNLSFMDLAIPVFLQGIAAGMIFLPIMIFTTTAVPVSTGFSGIIICAYARFIASLNSISGFYTLQLGYNQQYKEGFLNHLTVEDANFAERSAQYANVFVAKGYTADQANTLSTIMIGKAMGIQGQLLTNKAVFLVGALAMLAGFTAVIIFILGTKIIAFRKQRSLETQYQQPGV